MKIKTASLVDRFAESATLALAAKAKKMMAQGRDVINFAVGEPDFNTPDGVIEAALKAAKAGQTKYTPVAGVPSTRAAVAKRLTADYGCDFKDSEVLISHGGKQALFHFFQASLEPEDEVLIPVPYWTSFPEMVKMAGGKPVYIRPETGRLKPEDIELAITSKTKAIILNSPANPSGAVWSRAEMEAIGAVLAKHSIWVVSDDTYYTLTYTDEPWTSILKLEPSLKDRSCIIGSTSKSYAMTGWRLGWAVGPEALIKAMAKLQGQVTSGACSVSQAACEAAVGPYHSASEEFRQIFDRRRKLLKSCLEGFSYLEPEGAFYCFLKLCDQVEGSVAGFCESLLEEHELCLVPGEAFGEPDYARVSYALSEKQIEEGIQRLKKALKG